jgi:hypothetical protein
MNENLNPVDWTKENLISFAKVFLQNPINERYSVKEVEEFRKKAEIFLKSNASY